MPEEWKIVYLQVIWYYFGQPSVEYQLIDPPSWLTPLVFESSAGSDPRNPGIWPKIAFSKGKTRRRREKNGVFWLLSRVKRSNVVQIWPKMSHSSGRWLDISWGSCNVFCTRAISSVWKLPVIVKIIFLVNMDIKLSKKSKIIKNGSGTASVEFFEVGDFAHFGRYRMLT